MSSIDKLRKQTATEAKSIIESGISTLSTLETSYKSIMPYQGSDALSQAESAFVTTLTTSDVGVDASNDVVDGAYKITRDALSMGCDHIRILERFIGLHVPKMEDGNNFGVTVQMTIGKYLKETRESWEKSLSETSKYYSSRADAVDKFTHLPKSSITETKSSSSSNTTGGKDGPEDKTSSSTSSEEKIVKNDDGKPNVHRIKALAALDAQMYVDLNGALRVMMDDYMIIVDNFEKNWDKLENPRGKGYGGYGSGGSSMVY